MSEWWTYSLEDFLLFSPRVYWRMFELHNAAVWPLHVVALLLGAAILVWVVRPRPWSDRAIAVILGVAWIWVGWAFLWNRYSGINWAVAYVVPAFAAEALLLIWIGGLAGRLHFRARRTTSGVVGLVLILYALILHPFVAKLAGRSFAAAEVFGIAPDPTAIATLGLLAVASVSGPVWPLLVVPLAWCLVSGATLYALRTPEAWISLLSAGVAVASRFSSCADGQTSRRTPMPEP
jgi:hypothetical protein